MDNCRQIAAAEVFFVADSHFRDRRLPGESDRRDRFAAFCRHVPAGATLFLLGDIFDFYFEYSTVVSKRYFDIFCVLAECRSRGVELHFLGGNHDYWVGEFLPDALGIEVHHEDFSIACQGRTIRCAHGDMVNPDDRGYHALRAVIRNPVAIRLGRWVHPDLMAGIARLVSGESKRKKRLTQEQTAHLLADTVARNCYRWENDAFIMGHVHHPLHRFIDGRDFVIVGDWIDSFSYARLRDGKISLEKFTG